MNDTKTFKEYLGEHPDAVQIILQHGQNKQPNYRYLDLLGADNLIFCNFEGDPSPEEVLKHEFRVVNREDADWIMCMVEGYNGKAILDDTAVWCTW